jgi:SAM-dependent methyltransferase
MPPHAPHYDERHAARYCAGAPHLRHNDLRALYRRLAEEATTFAAARGSRPRVLDLGAGSGGATMPFVELGAEVTAVDDSPAQLARLRERAGDRVETIEADAEEALASLPADYDVVVASSFLHHVPDYLGFLDRALGRARARAVFLSFQDPLLYASLPRPTRTYAALSYDAWRLTQGDVLAGVGRRLRRRRGVYIDSVVEDVIEYHATRGGVDHEAVLASIAAHGFEPRLVRYFSTQARPFHALGRALRLENTFAVIATRDATHA